MRLSTVGVSKKQNKMLPLVGYISFLMEDTTNDSALNFFFFFLIRDSALNFLAMCILRKNSIMSYMSIFTYDVKPYYSVQNPKKKKDNV